jgi:hypothetical protein
MYAAGFMVDGILVELDAVLAQAASVGFDACHVITCYASIDPGFAVDMHKNYSYQ